MNNLPLWEPSAGVKQEAHVTRYMRWLAQTRGLAFQTREELWQWSVEHLEDFWASLWDFFQIQASQAYCAVLTTHVMPGASWFAGAELNYAEHIFRQASDDHPAIIFRSERHALVEISWQELRQKVGAIARSLRAMGVRRGDRVVAYMPNIPETMMAFLACASLGAIWSSCSPDFGINSVIDRFKQIEPKILFAVDGYQYGGKTFDRGAMIAELQQQLPSLEKIVLVPYLYEQAARDPVKGAINPISGGAINCADVMNQVPMDTGDKSQIIDKVGASNPISGGAMRDPASNPISGGAINCADVMNQIPMDTGDKSQIKGHVIDWREMISTPAEIIFEQVPFDHPLWILYSSGTTGLPKAIVQGHGGILLEHLKNLSLEMNLKPGDRFFWFTTTGWMMWNFLLSGLLVGATLLLYDGSPGYPDLQTLWQFAQDAGMTFLGTSAAYIASCMKAKIEPAQQFNLSKLQGIGSTGSPLPPEGFQWLYEHVKRDLWVASISGGTDVCSAFVNGSILLPVSAGELQCRSLGAKVEAFDEQGKAVIDEVGELVISEPLPSMPLFFWNDPEMKRYRESYFSVYPGIWRHGDWIKITLTGSAIIFGRSDSTINRAGIRMGSSEIYRIVESLPEILDSLIIGLERPNGGYYLPLFVVLQKGLTLDEALKNKIKSQLRTTLSPHHIPDEILAIPEVPRTLSGKKLEVPIKKLLMGVPAEKAISPDAMSNPWTIQYFLSL